MEEVYPIEHRTQEKARTRRLLYISKGSAKREDGHGRDFSVTTSSRREHRRHEIDLSAHDCYRDRYGEERSATRDLANKRPRERGQSVSMQELQRGYVFEGKYRIQGELGRGGFGMVYLAYQLGMDRHVALKVLNPNMGEDAARTAHERFLREVKIISKLRHPNTVTIHDFGETTDGLVYMVLEYVDGETLKSLLNRRGALDDARAIHIAMQIAKSLSEAHRHGIIHRDLKPANIMLSELGGETDFVKVLDFGIAQLRNKKKDQDLTTDGADGRQLIGTPRYMSPEQVRGDQLTGASDVYSLGLILYEMLTGERAVQGDTTMALITQQISPEPLRLGNLRRMHPKLQHITMRAVAKPTQSRYRTVDVMAQELEQALLEVRREALPGAASSSNDFLLGNQYDHYGSGSHQQVNQWGNPQQGPIRTTGSMDAVPLPHGGFGQPQQPYSSGQFIGQNPAPYSGNYPQQQMPGQTMPGQPYQTGPQQPVHPSGQAPQASFVASHSYQQTGQHWGASEDPTPPPFAMGNQTPAPPSSGFHTTPPGAPPEPSLSSLAPELPAPPNRFAESNFAPEPTLEPTPNAPSQRDRPGRAHHAKATSSGDTLSFLFNLVAICVLLPALVFAFYVSFIVMGASISLLLKGGSLRLIVAAVAAIAIPIVPLVAEGGRRERFKVVYSGLLKVRRALTIGVIINLGSVLLLSFAFSEHIVYELKTTPNWFLSDEEAARSEEGFAGHNKRFSKLLAENIEKSMLAAGMYDAQKASRQGGAGQPAMPLPTRPSTKSEPDNKSGKAIKKSKPAKAPPSTRKPAKPRSTMPTPTRPTTKNRKQRDTSKIKPVKDRSTSADTKKKGASKDDGEYVDW